MLTSAQHSRPSTKPQIIFRKQAWEVEWVESLGDARQILLAQKIDPIAILSDMNFPDGNTLDFLEEMRDKPIECSEWLFLTGYGSISDSVRALRLGAFDFIEKPCDLNRLNLQIEGAARSAKAQHRLSQEAQSSHTKYLANSFLGGSDSNKTLRSMLTRIIQVPFSSLVIRGETGTGKDLLAKILHYSGKRSTKPLVEINCAALPHDLLESEYLVLKLARLPMPRKDIGDCLSKRIKALCFWMKSVSWN